MTDTSSQPAKPEGEEKSKMDAAMMLLSGKRDFIVQDYASAAASLEEACKLLANLYGETAKECGEAYLFYGRALLELARQESDVLGNALESEEEKDDDDDDDDGEDGEEEKSQEGDSAENEEDVEEDLEKPEPALKEDTEPPPSEPGTSTAGPSGSSSPPKEEDVPNLQLAWEVLEIAKNIFKRQAEEDTENQNEHRLKVAEVLLRLGEISLESDNCEQAVEDFSECLKIQMELLEADSRKMAETYYQRGLAYSFGGLYQEAVNDFRDAVRVLELRLENCNRFVSENKDKERKGSLEDDPVWVAEREVEDLQLLLPEVRNRVQDTEDTIQQDCRALKDATIQKMRERLPATSPVKKSSDSGPEPSRPVNVITHLIKRKPGTLQRTSDGGSSAGSSTSVPKKVKSEVTETNGESSEKPLASETPTANDCEKPAASPLKTVVS
ncbi:protein HGV2 isoform X4 [Rhipicephalus sanguineus]|uniref:protein HGV2 isoform X4 n=1 Tax=Rhipicephalus sanguineus TaxID=34632 RepID=UPI0018956CE0|nr:protein HGV2 isoform X4 [Rhipicephalus sanguineus]